MGKYPQGQLLRSAPAVLCLFFLSRFLVICVTCTTWFTPKWMQTIVVIMKVSENIMLRMSINVRTCGSGDCGMRVRARSMRTPKAAELLIAANDHFANQKKTRISERLLDNSVMIV